MSSTDDKGWDVPEEAYVGNYPPGQPRKIGPDQWEMWWYDRFWPCKPPRNNNLRRRNVELFGRFICPVNNECVALVYLKKTLVGRGPECTLNIRQTTITGGELTVDIKDGMHFTLTTVREGTETKLILRNKSTSMVVFVCEQPVAYKHKAIVKDGDTISLGHPKCILYKFEALTEAELEIRQCRQYRGINSVKSLSK